jgi:hypothetical protein
MDDATHGTTTYDDVRRRAMEEPTNGGGARGVLTEAEHEVYDRQIRVWGVETQKKLSRGARARHDDESV